MERYHRQFFKKLHGDILEDFVQKISLHPFSKEFFFDLNQFFPQINFKNKYINWLESVHKYHPLGWGKNFNPWERFVNTSWGTQGRWYVCTMVTWFTRHDLERRVKPNSYHQYNVLCHEKTSHVSNYAFFTLLHKWVDKGQTHRLGKLQ